MQDDQINGVFISAADIDTQLISEFAQANLAQQQGRGDGEGKEVKVLRETDRMGNQIPSFL